MSDSSGAIDLFFDMPSGKRMSPERRFDMTSEYERGRPGVRAHLLVSASVIDRAAASFQGVMCSSAGNAPEGAVEGSDEGFQFLGQLRSSFRTEIRAINEILCRLQDE